MPEQRAASIAVAPLRKVPEDPDHARFASAFLEDVIAELASFPQLEVLSARTSLGAGAVSSTAITGSTGRAPRRATNAVPSPIVNAAVKTAAHFKKFTDTSRDGCRVFANSIQLLLRGTAAGYS